MQTQTKLFYDYDVEINNVFFFGFVLFFSVC